MNEILPGLFHWTAIHPRIKIEVRPYYLQPARVLLDPLLPPEGLERFRARCEPRDRILSHRNHYRPRNRSARP